jgi:hypothetical protein
MEGRARVRTGDLLDIDPGINTGHLFRWRARGWLRPSGPVVPGQPTEWPGWAVRMTRLLSLPQARGAFSLGRTGLDRRQATYRAAAEGLAADPAAPFIIVTPDGPIPATAEEVVAYHLAAEAGTVTVVVAPPG